MQKVYDPIKKQADAMEEEGRAWVGPAGFSFSDLTDPNEPLKLIMRYNNFGRVPATMFRNISKAIFAPISNVNLADIASLPLWNDRTKFDLRSSCSNSGGLSQAAVYPSQVPYTADVGVTARTQITTIAAKNQVQQTSTSSTQSNRRASFMWSSGARPIYPSIVPSTRCGAQCSSPAWGRTCPSGSLYSAPSETKAEKRKNSAPRAAATTATLS